MKELDKEENIHRDCITKILETLSITLRSANFAPNLNRLFSLVEAVTEGKPKQGYVLVKFGYLELIKGYMRES